MLSVIGNPNLEEGTTGMYMYSSYEERHILEEKLNKVLELIHSGERLAHKLTPPIDEFLEFGVTVSGTNGDYARQLLEVAMNNGLHLVMMIGRPSWNAWMSTYMPQSDIEWLELQ